MKDNLNLWPLEETVDASSEDDLSTRNLGNIFLGVCLFRRIYPATMFTPAITESVDGSEVVRRMNS